MNKTEKVFSPVMAFVKILFFMYMVTFILLLSLAFVLFKLDPGENIFKLWLIGVYVISCFLGGFFIGKKMKNRRFFWGFLIGAVYFGILLVVSLILKQGAMDNVTHMLMTLVLCVAPGTIGGMIS